MDLSTQAAWILIAAVVISLAYETFRATARAGVSKYDSMRSLLSSVPLYVPIVAAAVALFSGALWIAWIVLVMTIGLIGVSIFYYSPTMLPPRRPAMIDHLEDKVYTGLLFVVAALLIYRVAGVVLS
jgi:uncharacterized membrane protein YGL010W